MREQYGPEGTLAVLQGQTAALPADSARNQPDIASMSGRYMPESASAALLGQAVHSAPDGEANHKRPLCRRCLLQELPDQAALARVIAERIALLPEDQRADETMLAQRLALCKACDKLVNGMCILCGCYVELRCAKKTQICPFVPRRW